MKKFILAVCSVLACLSSQAQIGFGPEIGGGSANMKFVPGSVFTSSSTSAIFSGRIGGIVDIPFTKHLYFQSGLSYTNKGQERSYSFFLNNSTNDAEHRKLLLHYIDLPLHIVFKSGYQGEGRILLGMGAMFSYMAGGKTTFDAIGRYNDTPFVINQKYNADLILRKLDIGVSFFAGYELPTGLYFKAYYVGGVKDLGLFNEVSKNRTYGVSIGYMFGKNRNINKDEEGLIEK